MLEKLRETQSQKAQEIWSQLIQWSFDREDAKAIDAIVIAIQTYNILREKLTFYFEEVELNSAKAEKMKADYLRMQEWQSRQDNSPLLDPPPSERVLQLLDQLGLAAQSRNL